MEKLFLELYSVFRNKKILFSAIVFFVILTAIILDFRITLEEDISKTLPGENDRITLVLKHSRFTNKIILNIFSSDSLKPADPDSLISFAGELTDSLQNQNFSRFLAGSTYKISDSVAGDLINIFYENLPVFLTEKDFSKIDSLLMPERINQILEKDYKTLISPAGFTLKKNILQDPLGISYLALTRLKQFQVEDGYEIVDGYIFTKNHRNLLLFLNPLHPSSETRRNAIFFGRLDRLLKDMKVKFHNNINAEYYGAPAVAVGNADQIKNDIAVTVTVAIVIILLFVGVFFRSRIIPLISFLPAIFGAIMALALIFIIKGKVSTIALGIGSVLLGIIVDYALYFYGLYRSKDTVDSVLRDISTPILICSLTTSIAFFSLLFVRSEVLRDLGLFAGLSILGAALFSLIVLPHLMSLKHKPSEAGKLYLIERVVNYNFESNKLLISCLFLISILSLFYFRKADFEKDMYSMNFLSARMRTAEQHLNNIADISLKSVYVFSTGENLDHALAVNARTCEILGDLKRKNIIEKYSDAGSILVNDSIQKERIRRWSAYWTEEKKEELRKTISETGARLGFKADAFNRFYSFLGRDFRSADISGFNSFRNLFLNDMITETNDLVMVMSVVKVKNSQRSEIFSILSGEKNTVVIDPNEITSSLVSSIRIDFDLLVKLCLIFVTLTLIIAFGRIETGLIAALPMFISWLWTLGFMGLTGIKFNIFNIIVSTFVFGLGVDYSILMMQGFLLEYKYGQHDLPSYKTSIFLSSFTTIVGVGVLQLARHPALHSIALISVVGLISVVMISYTIDPVLFKWLVAKNGKKRVLPVTLSDILVTVYVLSVGLILFILLNILLLLVLPLPITSRIKKRILHRAIFLSMKISSYGMIGVRFRKINESHEEFKTPSIIIANHQSHIDLPLLLMQSSKIIVLTNKWVWNNPLYALVIRYLGFYSVTKGYEPLVEKLRKKTEEGYSILVFPEGTRSPDSSIKRFHKGAFLLAEMLNLDIVPIIIHGAGDCMTKGENHIKGGTITVKIFPRIRAEETGSGNDYHERTKRMLRFYRQEYECLKSELETPAYFRQKLIRNYIYKGPILEWYTRVKIRLENNWETINRIVPAESDIVDIGCGYGMISYMLGFTSRKRNILGIDWDPDKIKLANNCISKTEKINFVAGDAVAYAYPDSDVFLLSDVLHYIPEDQQLQLLHNCIMHLKPGGLMIVRDADKDLKRRHLGTRYTEFFSTRFGYNKSLQKKLFFFSGNRLKDLAERNGMKIEIIDQSSLTSNILYILRR